ncbi:hypothetical protein MKX03_011580 [Papaver bracteatum]|nr:hypothetical protein MKX03_011580 [Papaver bracteatum]
MGASIIIFPLFLFYFLCFPNFISSVKNCDEYNQCSKGEPGISYPFRIKGRQNERCGFPGFDFTCNMSKTVLELPFSEPFFVSYINYGCTYNEIQLLDPENCLTRRFLNLLNLSGTPFVGIRFTDYSFFNCSSDVSNSFTAPVLFYSTRIRCLSSSTHTLFATSPESSDSLWLGKNCALIATIQVPVERYNSGRYPYILSEPVHLTWRWNDPHCKRNCSKNPNVPYVGSSTDGQFYATKLLISIGIIFPILFASVVYCRFCRDANNQSQEVSSGVVQTTPQSVIITTGLGGSAIQSLPMVVLGESGRLLDPDLNTCAICLSDYRPTETLKTLPACNHCFHADCIDVWLHLKSTCPVCRNSPLIC